MSNQLIKTNLSCIDFRIIFRKIHLHIHAIYPNKVHADFADSESIKQKENINKTDVFWIGISKKIFFLFLCRWLDESNGHLSILSEEPTSSPTETSIPRFHQPIHYAFHQYTHQVSLVQWPLPKHLHQPRSDLRLSAPCWEAKIHSQKHRQIRE